MTKETKSEELSPRERMKALKESMRADQKAAAVEVASTIDTFSAKLQALREKTIPGEIVEQSIDNVLNMAKQVPGWLKHILEDEGVKAVEETAPAPTA